ncbi:MAG: hypothetical protein HY784_11650 [Chloroflexi bacterium]|nr:hypothetical protein [Chloroflexota bacterium]
MSQTDVLIQQVTTDLRWLPESDVSLVAEFVAFLKQRPVPPRPVRKVTVAEIREVVHQRAAELQAVPREQIVAEFRVLAEEMRQRVIARDLAHEGDWQGD